jgi:hypothetical protein
MRHVGTVLAGTLHTVHEGDANVGDIYERRKRARETWGNSRSN